MSERVTRLEAVVLGLLADEPSHAYALKARLGPGLERERQVNDGVLYPLLDRLARRGLIRESAADRGPRGRRVFRIAPKGRRAFNDWLRGDRDEGLHVDYELFIDHPLVKLLFWRHMDPELLEEKVDALTRAAQERLEAIEELERLNPDGGEGTVPGAVAEIGRAREEAIIAALGALRVPA